MSLEDAAEHIELSALTALNSLSNRVALLERLVAGLYEGEPPPEAGLAFQFDAKTLELCDMDENTDVAKFTDLVPLVVATALLNMWSDGDVTIPRTRLVELGCEIDEGVSEI